MEQNLDPSYMAQVSCQETIQENVYFSFWSLTVNYFIYLFIYIFIYLVVCLFIYWCYLKAEYEIDNYQDIITVFLVFSLPHILIRQDTTLPHMLRFWRAPKSLASIFLCLGGFKLFSLQRLCEQ